jgi:hypothetical protein
MLVVNSSGISLAVGAGNGTFTPPTANFAVLVGGSSAVAPDIDGDGKLDVVVSGWAGTNTLIGNGSGGFAAQARLPVPTGEAAGDVVAGDFDGDGNPDLAFVTDQGLYVVLNGR